jgi:hypothetical protein
MLRLHRLKITINVAAERVMLSCFHDRMTVAALTIGVQPEQTLREVTFQFTLLKGGSPDWIN